MDDDYLVLHAEGHQHAGIVYVPQRQRLSVGAAVNSLTLIYEVLTPAQMRGHIEYL